MDDYTKPFTQATNAMMGAQQACVSGNCQVAPAQAFTDTLRIEQDNLATQQTLYNLQQNQAQLNSLYPPTVNIRVNPIGNLNGMPAKRW